VVGTKQRSLAHILLCILLFWLANIQDGRPLVILGWRHGVRVLARARALERASVRECVYARVQSEAIDTYVCTLVCTGNSVYRAMHGAMHIYARDNSHWRSLSLLEVY